jgi:hypothetical protein
VKETTADLEAQFHLEIRITEAMHRDFVALMQVRNLRSRLKEQKHTEAQNVKSSAEVLDRKAAELEGTVGGYGATFLTTPAGRGLARLNGGLANLLAAVDSADAAPTTQAVAMFDQLEQALDEQLERWLQLQRTDVQALNQELKQAGMQAIDVGSLSKPK